MLMLCSTLFRQAPGMKNINLNEIRQLDYFSMRMIIGNSGTIYRFPGDNYIQLTKEVSGTNANLMGISYNNFSDSTYFHSGE